MSRLLDIGAYAGDVRLVHHTDTYALFETVPGAPRAQLVAYGDGFVVYQQTRSGQHIQRPVLATAEQALWDVLGPVQPRGGGR